MDLGLAGRAAIVTGGSRGIGRAVARALALEGCDVLVCGRDGAALAEVVGELEAIGRRARSVAADLADDAAAAEIVAACDHHFGRLDILVNNAGGGAPKRLERVTPDDWAVGFEVNFFAAARLSLAAAPAMRAAGWGRIVNVASTYAREPSPTFAVYGAAKAALVNLTKSLSRAYSAEGVLSNCVVPGVTMTEMVEGNAAAVAERTGTTPEAVMAAVMAEDPVAMGRFGDPREVAAAIVFLASSQASWITGATLAVDGSTLRST